MRFSSPKIHHFSNEFWCRVPILVVVVIVVAVATRPVVNSDCCDSFYCYCCMLFPGFSRPTCSLLVVIFRFAALRHAIQFTTKRLKLAVSEEALCLYVPVGSADGHEQTVAICFNMHLACLVVLASRFALLLAEWLPACFVSWRFSVGWWKGNDRRRKCSGCQGLSRNGINCTGWQRIFEA